LHTALVFVPHLCWLTHFLSARNATTELTTEAKLLLYRSRGSCDL